MSAHSPGPWRIGKPDPYGSCEIKTDDFNVADVHGGGDASPANARLIAAAPDLLRELRTAWYMIQQAAPDADCSAIEAAIAKAEGAA